MSTDQNLSPMEQLIGFVEWERKHNPGTKHIAEWALAEIERLQHAQPPLDRAALTITGAQARELLAVFGGDEEAEVALGWFRETKSEEDGEAMPAGLYAWMADYPEEGRIHLAGLAAEEMESHQQQRPALVTALRGLLASLSRAPTEFELRAAAHEFTLMADRAAAAARQGGDDA